MDVVARIEEILKAHPVVLFMKGQPHRPMCGFSRMAVAALKVLDIPFASVDILEDLALRQGLKDFAQWPTFPQLYIEKAFVGGCDIIQDMLASGELEKRCQAFRLPQVSEVS